MQQQNFSQTTQPEPKKNNSLIYILSIALIVFILLSGYLAFAYTKGQKRMNELNEQIEKLQIKELQKEVELLEQEEEIMGLKTYEGENYKFKYFGEKVEFEKDGYGQAYSDYWCNCSPKEIQDNIPENWIYEESIPIISGFFTVNRFDNKENLPIREWIQKYEVCGFEEKPYGEDVVINGILGIRMDGPGTCPPGGSAMIDTVYLSKDKSVYVISFLNDGGGMLPLFKETEEGIAKCLKEREEIFEKILSTFKIID